MISKKLTDNRPLGVFDSGIGGLTVVKEIKRKFPNERIIYLGDTARVPYGTRGREIVKQFALEDLKFLLKYNVKAVVIACNTASALAGPAVISASPVPVWTMIKAGADGAKKATKNKHIGVIGTRGTIRSLAYQKELKGYNIVAHACPLLVPLVEEGEIKGWLAELLVKKYLESVKYAHIDTLILGCTHYPLLEALIHKEMGNGVVLINPGKEVVEEMKFKPAGQKLDQDKFFVTDLTDRYKTMAVKFLGNNVKIQLVKL